MQRIFLTILLLVPMLMYSQYGDEQLYMAYMSGDLSLWGDYLRNGNWETMDDAEKTRFINYEYGYIPVEADKGNPDVRRMLDNYKQHIEAHKYILTASQYTAYKSAACAYEYLLDKHLLFSQGLQSFKLAHKAVELDPQNPLALSLSGNVSFYAPTLFGGSKKKALQLFEEAERIMEADTAYRYMWNYPALQLCIAQCYDKIGDKEKAKRQYERILAIHPDFDYARKEFVQKFAQ